MRPRARRELETLIAGTRSSRRVRRATIAAGAALVLCPIGGGSIVAAARSSSEDGQLLIVGAASLVMLLPAIAVWLGTGLRGSPRPPLWRGRT
jgi:NADPH:quinone reductase-like Zn-dependent oxidoreductase